MKNFLTLFLVLLVVNSCSAAYLYRCSGCGASLKTMCTNSGGTYESRQAYCGGSSLSTYTCCKMTTTVQRANFFQLCENSCGGTRASCSSCVTW